VLFGYESDENDSSQLLCSLNPSLYAVQAAQQAFGVYNPRKLRLSPFLKSLGIQPWKIKVMQQFVWCFTEKELNTLKQSMVGRQMWCGEQMVYVLSNGEHIQFKIGVDRQVTDSGFYIKFEKVPSSLQRKSMNGRLSLMVNELNWMRNDWALKDLREGYFEGVSCFADKLIDSLSLCTLRVALVLYD